MSDLEFWTAGRECARAATRSTVSRGQRIGRVSSEWFSRPADERYLSLTELHASVQRPRRSPAARTVESAAIRVEAAGTTRSAWPRAAGRARAGRAHPLELRPAREPRRRTGRLPAPAAGAARRHQPAVRPDLHRAEMVKTLETEDGRTELRAVTGPDYGRIYDHELVEAVMRIAGNGTGDTRWKVPGVLDWSSGIYNPQVDVTEGHDDPLCLRPRRLPVPGRRPQPDRGRPPARRLARPLLPRLLLLELRGRRPDARHRQLLSARGLREPQSLGRRGVRGDHHPALEVCRLALRARRRRR